jgi:hypothetical protein
MQTHSEKTLMQQGGVRVLVRRDRFCHLNLNALIFFEPPERLYDRERVCGSGAARQWPLF